MNNTTIGADAIPFVPCTFDDFGLDPYQFRVYCRIVRRAGNGSCFESVNNIATACGMTKKRVHSALKFLCAHKLIKKEPSPKIGATVNYYVTPSSEWIPVATQTQPDAIQTQPGAILTHLPGAILTHLPDAIQTQPGAISTHLPGAISTHLPGAISTHKGITIKGNTIKGIELRKERKKERKKERDDFSFSENQKGVAQGNPDPVMHDPVMPDPVTPDPVMPNHLDQNPKPKTMPKPILKQRNSNHPSNHPSDRPIVQIDQTPYNPNAKPDTTCPACGMLSRAFEIERWGMCSFCWQKDKTTHRSPLALINARV